MVDSGFRTLGFGEHMPQSASWLRELGFWVWAGDPHLGGYRSNCHAMRGSRKGGHWYCGLRAGEGLGRIGDSSRDALLVL